MSVTPPETSGKPEGLLREWLAETNCERTRALMETIAGTHAAPLIRSIVSRRLAAGREGGRIQRADIEDVASSALCSLLARFERLKARGATSEISSFSGYVAVTAYNACNEYFRAKRPAWLSLAMKIRYLAEHSPALRLWQDAEGQQICGRARDFGRDAVTKAAQLAEEGSRFRRQTDPNRVPLAEIVERALSAAGGPLVLETLTDTVAEWMGLKETRAQSLDEQTEDHERRWEPADQQTPADARLMGREFMQCLWKEICELPLEHRKALLLNLRDSGGGDIQLFDSLGVAPVREIAAVLEMEPTVFAGLWNRLPLDDASIASELGISRQDVINRRSAARKRLSRRLNERQRK